MYGWHTVYGKVYLTYIYKYNNIKCINIKFKSEEYKIEELEIKRDKILSEKLSFVEPCIFIISILYRKVNLHLKLFLKFQTENIIP